MDNENKQPNATNLPPHPSTSSVPLLVNEVQVEFLLLKCRPRKLRSISTRNSPFQIRVAVRSDDVEVAVFISCIDFHARGPICPATQMPLFDLRSTVTVSRNHEPPFSFPSPGLNPTLSPDHDRAQTLPSANAHLRPYQKPSRPMVLSH